MSSRQSVPVEAKLVQFHDVPTSRPIVSRTKMIVLERYEEKIKEIELMNGH
jgi:hypothetical protein